MGAVGLTDCGKLLNYSLISKAAVIYFNRVSSSNLIGPTSLQAQLNNFIGVSIILIYDINCPTNKKGAIPSYVEERIPRKYCNYQNTYYQNTFYQNSLTNMAVTPEFWYHHIMAMDGDITSTIHERMLERSKKSFFRSASIKLVTCIKKRRRSKKSFYLVLCF
jgi:hypothetical protein